MPTRHAMMDPSRQMFGTGNTIPKWISPNVLGNSIMTDDGAKVTVGGNLDVDGALVVSPAVGVSSVAMLNVSPASFAGGPVLKGAPVLSIGSLLTSDVGIGASEYGIATGLDLAVINTNLTKAGASKGASSPFTLRVTQTHDQNVWFKDLAGIIVALDDTATASALQNRGVSVIVDGDNTSVGLLGGIVGCYFQGNNATAVGGNVKGLFGYSNLSHFQATGASIGTQAYSVCSGSASNPLLLINYQGNFLGYSDTSAEFLLRGTGHILTKAGLWLTTTTDISASNPSAHLVIATGITPNPDLFVEGEAEIKNKLWLEGDVAHASGNSIGLHGATPVGQSTGWSVTNPVTRKTFDTAGVSLQNLAEVVGTIIDTLKTRGDFAA